jgi:glyoxylase-like metal-dependent hydrolase (beta-lactamase superfamily II)
MTSQAENPARHTVYVLRYAERMASRQQQFYGAIDRPSDPMPISYFVWLIVGPYGPVLVDTGFTEQTAQRLGRTYVVSPPDAVRAAGVVPDSLATVVLTHLHYDHAGGTASFPAASLVLQDREMAFWTGRHGRQVARGLGMPHLVLPEDVLAVGAANFAGRVRWVDGDAEIVPGVWVHHVGGHTPGMQVVRVATALGHVVLASDASHFYENIERDRPFAVLDSVPGALQAFADVRALAGGTGLIIPGHDPSVLGRYPPADLPGLRGHAVVIG